LEKAKKERLFHKKGQKQSEVKNRIVREGERKKICEKSPSGKRDFWGEKNIK